MHTTRECKASLREADAACHFAARAGDDSQEFEDLDSTAAAKRNITKAIEHLQQRMEQELRIGRKPRTKTRTTR